MDNFTQVETDEKYSFLVPRVTYGGCSMLNKVIYDPHHTHIGLVRPGSAPAGTRPPTHIRFHLVPGTWNRPPDRGYFAGPWFDFREPRPCGGFSPANTRGNLPQDMSKSRRELVGTLCRACVPCVFEAGRQQDVKSRLFGGLRGRKGRETSGSDMFRRNKTTAGGSWCQNSSLKFWPPGTELCSTCGTRASLVHHFARPDRVLTPICVLNSS